MDIYEYLKMDHEKVAHLFKLFKKSQIIERKKEIVALLTKELIVHAHSEQETFYKALEQHMQSKEEALHGDKEHKEIEEQIKVINDASGVQWEKAVLKLKELVDHHVKDEEGPLFDKAKEVLSKEEALILKEQMHYLKGAFLIWLDKSIEKPEEKKPTVKKPSVKTVSKKSVEKKPIKKTVKKK
jgi:hypothetical protein